MKVTETVTNEVLTRTPAIKFEQVTKQYGQGARIIDAMSLTIAPGEFVSLIGPSGCGKSTLLKMVAGLSPVSSGRIVMERLTLVNARRITSFIFQDATLLPWRTVRQNVGLGLELEGMAKDRRGAVVDSLLGVVGLEHVADAYPRQLSGGMKMRVSIARALASQPRVLLLDEPFAALDEMTRDRMNEELLRLYRERGWTVLFVTHSVAEAVFLSTRVLVLAPHPGHVAHDVAIDLPLERTAETRGSEAFDRQVTQVSRLLREVGQA
jgi:NitT/TauT family transport system ATP-binding protein